MGSCGTTTGSGRGERFVNIRVGGLSPLPSVGMGMYFVLSTIHTICTCTYVKCVLKMYKYRYVLVFYSQDSKCTIRIPGRYERRSRPHVERSGKVKDDETASLRHAAAGLGGRAAAGNVRGGPRYDGGRGSIAISCQTIRCATRQTDPRVFASVPKALLHVCALLAPYLAPCFAWRVHAARAEAGGGQPSPTLYPHAPQLPNSQPSPSSTHLASFDLAAPQPRSHMPSSCHLHRIPPSRRLHPPPTLSPPSSCHVPTRGGAIDEHIRHAQGEYRPVDRLAGCACEPHPHQGF